MKRKRTRARRHRQGWRRLRARWRALPGVARALLAVVLLCALGIAYQVMRKPTELLGVVPSSTKSPSSTWSAYGALFREHSTDVVPPELLAALVQVESAGRSVRAHLPGAGAGAGIPSRCTARPPVQWDSCR